MGKINCEWENARSGRSRCARCHVVIEKSKKRLVVPVKFGIRDGFQYYCEICAAVKYDINSIGVGVGTNLGSSDCGKGRFYKHFRMIRVSDSDK
jgi:hypothetical protein